MMKGFSLKIISLAVVLSFGIMSLSAMTNSEENDPVENSRDLGGVLPILTHWGAFEIHDLPEIIPGPIPSPKSDKFIVQFRSPISSDLAPRLRSQGISVLAYLPESSYIIDLEGNDPDILRSNPAFAGISILPPSLKLMPDLYNMLDSEEPVWEVDGSRSLIVDLFHDDPDAYEKLERITTWTLASSPTRFIVGLPLTSIDDLISIDSVEWVEPYYPFVLHNDIAKDLMGVPQVWNDHGLTGAGQLITIADTGIDTGVDSHSVDGDMIADLDNRVTPNTWAGYSAIDTHSHGTHVAGSVAGNGSLSNGSIKGMAPEADIFFQAIANESAGNPLQLPSNLSLIFKQAYDNGSRIHTNSWGSSVYGRYTTSSWDVDWFLYKYPEMIILFSAGNSGMDYYKPWGTYNPDGKVDEGSIGSPATAKNCITVGASENQRTTGGFQGTWYSGWGWKYTLDPVRSDTPSDDPNGLAAFSSRGPTDDGRLKPDVVGPGTNILSLRSTQTSATGWGTYAGNSNYLFMGGTSMSTPLTAGTVALIRQYYNSSLDYDTPSGALLKATLINGAVDLTPGQFGTSNATTQEINRRPDNDQGWGRVNLTESIHPENGEVSFIDDLDGIKTGDEIVSTLEVDSSSKDLRVTLVWADHPPSMSASIQLVNDLDLKLEAPNGTIYNGNDLAAPFNDSVDRLNPVEGILVESPAIGTWKLYVEGYNIPMGPQHFAVVASGGISNFSGVIDLDREYYSTEGDPIGITLFDQDLIGSGTVVVNASSDSFPAGRQVTLVEKGSTGLFEGSLYTSNVSTSNTSRLQVDHDDPIIVSYTDSDPSGTFNATAVAKDPVRLDLKWMPEYALVQAEGERISLEGSMDTNITAWWSLGNLGSDLRPLHDDGNSTFGDPSANDGNYSDIWEVPSGLDGEGRIMVHILDPFLGNRTYGYFDLLFNSSVPRYPKDLQAFVQPEGNKVTLDWSDSTETDISGYGLFTDGGTSNIGTLEEGWSRILNISASQTQYTIADLIDGTTYGFRVSAFDGDGYESSLSLPVFATPSDVDPPNVDLLTIPYTIVGTANLEFTGSPDLEIVELQYYNDSNENGLLDDGVWMNASSGPPSDLVWDTRISSGGPGNINRMFIRYRGLDEVPNFSDWTMEAGFRIDNLGPASVELVDAPSRITNVEDHEAAGISEGDGYVHIYLNGVYVTNSTCDPQGSFNFVLNLSEGLNELNLSAYDQFGAGPTNRTYHFSLDTQDPIALIDVEDQSNIIREILHGGYILNSSSYDLSEDPQFQYIENITWTYREPNQSPLLFYSREWIHLPFATLGTHELTLRVRDPAGNIDTTTLIIEVIDTTMPDVNINGPLVVDERKPITYEANYTDNDPRIYLRENFSLEWNVTGPDGFFYSSTEDPFVLWYPGPGYFNVTLEVTDGGNNTNSTSIIVEVTDTTPPLVDIIGNRYVILGQPETYTANVSDNDIDFPEGAIFSWNLSYLDGPPSGWWSEYFSGESFTFNYTQYGAYTLILEVTDRSGNTRGFQININADGDLTPPKVQSIAPAPNSTYQFSENVAFTIRFSELMNRSTLNDDTIHMIGPDGELVNISLSYKNVKGATEVKIDHGPLMLGSNYSIRVFGEVMDTWNNKMIKDVHFNYTIRTNFKLVSPWGSELETYFSNFSIDQNIVLRFSNPVEPGSLRNHMRIQFLTTDLDKYGNEITRKENKGFDLIQGETDNEIIVIVEWNEGVEYNITVFQETVDVFGYNIDHEYSWQFKTYLPPAAEPVDDDDADTDDDPLPDWMNNWVIWVIFAVAILFLVLIIAVFGMIRRKRNLKKIWAKEEEALRRRTSIYEEPPGEKPIVENDPTPEKIDEPEPASASYEDLYGSSTIPEPEYPSQTEEVIESSFMDTPAVAPVFSPPEKSGGAGVEWDEDEEGEMWGEDDDEDWESEEDEEELEW